MGKATDDFKLYTTATLALGALFGTAVANDIYQGIKKAIMEYRGYEAIPVCSDEMSLKKYRFEKTD